jgi:succinate dehydrogenase flavin-adding protein (antitoxin of CptAB toxin-antitoxin module)
MEIHYLTKQVGDLKSLLQLKDQEIMQQMRKYDSLAEKFNKSVADSIPKNKVAYMKENRNNISFPPVEKIPNEKLREAYGRLYQSVKEIVDEKDQILDNLKRETIDNEEQRNYIEILKQTIDATISKLNIANSLQNQK